MDRLLDRARNDLNLSKGRKTRIQQQQRFIGHALKLALMHRVTVGVEQHG